MSSSPLRRLIRYAEPHRRTVRAATAYSILNKVFDLAPPALIGTAVDVVVRREQSILAQAGVTSTIAQLWVLCGLTLVIWGLESVFQYAYAVKWRNLAQTIQHDLRVDGYTHLQKLELGFFEDERSGRLMAILNDDVNQLERFLDSGASALIQVVTTVIVIGTIFFALAPGVAIFAMLPMPIVLYGSIRYQRLLLPRYREVRERASLINGQLEANLRGIATIKSFTAEDKERERIAGLSMDYRLANREAIRFSSMFSPLIRMVIVVGFIATLALGGWLSLQGRLAVGAYSVLVFMTQRLLWPLTRLGATLDLYQRAMASTERVLDLLDRPPARQSGERALPRAEVRGEIAFEGVEFGYPGRAPLLTGLDLDIKAGETVAVVGATGAGKTTVIKLILRFYDALNGSVRIDGHDVRELRLEDLRGAIGLVSQDTFLFHGSVRENLAYGKADATDKQLREAARLAEALGFIEELPQGFDTVVGERGQKLSGGQRQRLSIARALLKDPPILIFDEATSSVDNETEAAIQRSLARIAKGRTTIVIAHRLSTVVHADRIVVLEAGRLIEQGRHEELLALDGLYAALWRVQTGDAALARS